MVVACEEWSPTVAKAQSFFCLYSFSAAEQIRDSISSEAWSLFLIIGR